METDLAQASFVRRACGNASAETRGQIRRSDNCFGGKISNRGSAVLSVTARVDVQFETSWENWHRSAV